MPPDSTELFRVEGFGRAHPVSQQRLEHTNVGFQPGQAEIADLERPHRLPQQPALAPRFGDENVSRMQVLVDIAGGMNVVECLEYVARHIGNPAIRVQAPAGDQIGEREAATFDDEIEGVLVLERVVDERDVGMAHDQQLAQFVLPDAANLPVGLVVRQQDLGDQRISPIVAALVHHAESALAYLLADEVAALIVEDHFAADRQPELPRLAKCQALEGIEARRLHRQVTVLSAPAAASLVPVHACKPSRCV